MQLEIQGQNYFLQFHQGEQRWYLLKPTFAGVEGMRVLDDRAPGPQSALFLQEDQEDQAVN